MKLNFKNGKFKILQVSDTQDLQYVRYTMLDMLDKAYDLTKPDLVLLTGDNVLGNHFRDARFYSKYLVTDKEKEYAAMKKAINYVVDPIDKRGIPFSMIYGNHDDRNEISKEEQADIFRAYSTCVGLDGGEESGDCDTFNIPIYSEDGCKILFNIWMLDSGWYDKELDKCFEQVKPEAVEWYKKKCAELKSQNGGKVVPSLMFQHIPLIETLSLIEECAPGEKGAKGPDGKFYKLKAGCEGVMGEYPSCVSTGNGQFEAMKECGDVKAVVFGHDHLNSFTAEIDGIDIIQTPCTSFRCYGSRDRGVRLFTVYENGEYESEMLTYKDLCGSGFISEFRYLWDADDMWKKKAALCVGAGAAAVGVSAALIAHAVHKK